MSGREGTTADRPRLRPAVVFAIWTLYGVLMLTQWSVAQPSGAPQPWKAYGPAIIAFGTAWTWAAWTWPIAVLARRARPTLRAPLPLLAHAAAIPIIHATLWLADAFGFYFVARQWPSQWFAGYAIGIMHSAVLYAGTAFGVLAVDHARVARQRAERAAQLEADLAGVRLDTLRRQLRPHFLFNTLNTIASLIETDPPRAGEMVARLGELLRQSLDEHERPLIALGDELAFVRLYAGIEQVRFESWLAVREDVDPDTLDALVPPMILQPLVENAIRHGIAPSGRRGTIAIRAEADGRDRLVLEVVDDGGGLRHGAQSGQGIGLRATRERLQHLFGDGASLVLVAAGGATCARIELPFVRAVT